MKPYTLEQMLETAPLWENTYCELANGWPDLWVIIFRTKPDLALFGKIGGDWTFDKRPTAAQIEQYKIRLLKQRYQSKTQCDANRICERLSHK